MSCDKSRELDLSGFIVDSNDAEWADFRAHYPSCVDCSRAVAKLTALGEALAASGAEATGDAHPTDEQLEQYQIARGALTVAEQSSIAAHLAGCPTCSDALAVLRDFDFSQVAAIRAEHRAAQPAGLLAGVRSSVRSMLSRGRASGEASAPLIELPALEPQAALQSKARPADDAATGTTLAGVLATLGGSDSASVHGIPVGQSHFGRSPAAEIRIESPLLAREEVRFAAEPGGVRIDWVRPHSVLQQNGSPAQPGPLADGDVLEVPGEFRFVFRTVPAV